jgi:hypothetical protein
MRELTSKARVEAEVMLQASEMPDSVGPAILRGMVDGLSAREQATRLDISVGKVYAARHFWSITLQAIIKDEVFVTHYQKLSRLPEGWIRSGEVARKCNMDGEKLLSLVEAVKMGVVNLPMPEVEKNRYRWSPKVVTAWVKRFRGERDD